MSSLKILLLIISLYNVKCSRVNSERPRFSNHYFVEGVINLPYAEIKEPFKAWYDQDHSSSRIDYYGDLVKTVQRGGDSASSFGVNYELAYMVDTEGDPERVCFQVNGTNDSPVSSQSALPDLSQFKYVGRTTCHGLNNLVNDILCEKWEYTVTNGDKKNVYTFWLKRDQENNPIPVHYLMFGYDSLLGSHFDKYEISYRKYNPGPVDQHVFDFVDNYTCRSFPGPGVKNVALNNPIKEFVNNYDQHIQDEFNSFKVKHNKKYDDLKEHRKRETIFRHNYRFITSKNRNEINYKLKVNHLADLTKNEMKALRGRLFSNTTNNGGRLFTKDNYNLKDLPSQWDWRLFGAVTPVKDQAICGSCWSFGTTGTIEGVYFVKTGHLLRLSQQQLIDCSWNEGDDGCNGGEDFRAYDYIMKAGGIATEDDYGHYLGQDGICHDKTTTKSVRLSGFYNVTPYDGDALKVALYNNGPITIAIDAAPTTFSFYSHGVYYDTDCKNRPEDLDHQVLAVGYGTLKGQDYWLVKNSWSTYWGNDGYILISAKNNNCGVLTDPSFPVIEN